MYTNELIPISEPYDIKLSIEGVDGDIILNNSNSYIFYAYDGERIESINLKPDSFRQYRYKNVTITMNLNGEILTCQGIIRFME